MDETHKKIIDDSKFLSLMINEQEMDFDEIKNTISFEFDLLEELYSDNYVLFYGDKEMISLINQLHFLESSKIIEVLIFNYFLSIERYSKYCKETNDENFNEDITSVYTNIKMQETFELTLVKYNCLDLLIWLNSDKTLKKKHVLFREACNNGYLKIAKWVYSLEHIDIYDDVNLFLMCEKGHINILQWIYILVKKYVLDNSKFLFRSACEYDRIELADWIYSLCDFQHNCDIFNNSCINGRLKTSKYLYGLNEIKYQHTSKVFKKVIENGYLEMSQWIYSSHKFNIHDNNDWLFRNSCRNGNLKMSQWLYSIGEVNIHVYNDESFENACTCGNLETAKWLYGIGDFNPQSVIQLFYKFSMMNNEKHIKVLNWLKTL